jgi:two-component system, NtrC family, response regulator HydG
VVGSSHQILIVDDEIDTCANMVDIFSEMGYQVDIAHDGLTALSLVENRKYDVALLDLMMPGMDGAAVYQEIKRLRPETTTIVITAYPEHPRAATAISKGAWKVLAKPVDLPKLFRLIEEAVDQPLLLVVDDDPDFCANLWDLLHDRGYRIAVAHDAAAAKQLLVDNAGYQLVLLDMKLPGGDGDAVLQVAKSLERTVPIIVITGYRSEYESRIAGEHGGGVREVLIKPLDVAQLLNAVKRLVESKNEI